MEESEHSMLQNIFDTHAHYDDEAFDADRDEVLSKVLPEGGVVRVVDCAVDLLSSVKVLDLRIRTTLSTPPSRPVRTSTL